MLKKLNIPVNVPSFILNKYFITVFNKFFYAKTKNQSNKKINLFNYFYPLDKINN